MEIRFGSVGWSYAGWKETFYPKSMNQKNYLNFYSKIFDSTEVNSTFYNVPSLNTTKNWFEQTPNNFWFTVKLTQNITHKARLKPSSELNRFLTSMEPLHSKLKIITIQLPPSLSFKESKPRLDKMLNHLPKNYRYALEGRQESWFSRESIEYLSEKNLCLVWNEIEGIDNPAPITSDFIYLRMIGDRSIPESQFGAIIKDRTYITKKWVNKIKKLENETIFVQVMMSNHFAGFSPQSINLMRHELGMSELKWLDTTQKSLIDFVK